MGKIAERVTDRALPRPRRFRAVRLSAAGVLAVALVSGPRVEAWADVPRSEDAPAGEPGRSAQAGLAVGGGAIAGDPASAVDLHAHLGGERYALGLGARLHYTAGGGFRTEEWDELAEFIGIIRYALYERRAGGDRAAISAAAGELGDVRHGQGTVMAGYASGLSLDHGRFGAQARARYDAVAAEAMIDNLAAPRILGLRASAKVTPQTRLGISFHADARAPAAGGEAAVGIASLDGRLSGDAKDGRYRGYLYMDAASAAGLAAGLHAGAGGDAGLGQAGARVAARGEIRAGTGGYVPGWFGPLYERDRLAMRAPGADTAASQLDVARGGDLGGLAGLGELRLSWPGIGEAGVTYAGRPALADHLVVRLEAPHFEDVQAALWGVMTPGGGRGQGMALASEIRAELPRRYDLSFELARLYRQGSEGSPAAAWKAIATFGAALTGR